MTPAAPAPACSPCLPLWPKRWPGEHREAGSPGPGRASAGGSAPVPVPCCAMLCHAGEKPLQIVTITFAGDLHAGTVFTEEQ